MKLRIIIVDDEPLARRLIVNLLKNVDDIEIVGQFGTGKESIEAINSLKPDILFLDIQLKDMNGFEVLEQVHVRMPVIIFVTAFDSYAIEAFNVFAFDYILKPVTEERFYKSINRVIDTFNEGDSKDFNERITNFLVHIRGDNLNTGDNTKSRIPIPFGNKTIFVNKQDIIYILASNYHIELYTAEAKYVLRNSMYLIMDELDSKLFVRIHRSSIINLSFVNELINSAYGEIDVKMEGGKKLRVSKGYRKQFLIKTGLRK